MKEPTRYAAAFGIGALAGIANELAQNRRHWWLDSPSWKVPISTCVASVYGWSAVIALAFFDAMKRFCPKVKSGVLLILIATVLIGFAEGLFGQVSKQFHGGKKTWQYPESWVPMMDGYVSLVSSAFFGIGIAAFYFFVYKPCLAK